MLCLVCLFSLVLGQVLSSSLILTPQQSDTRFARLGENVTLGCTLEGAEIGTWYYNNVPQDQATVTSEDDSSSVRIQLEIPNIRMAQAGWYTCASSTDTERVERDFLLIVGGEPKLQVQALDPYRVQEGTRVELPCFVVGTPQPEVTWFDSDGHQIFDGQDNKYRVDPTTNSLVIFDVDGSVLDTGNFSCNASNHFSNRTYRFSFAFSSDTSPDFTRPDFHTDFSPASDTVLAVPLEDQPVTLTCNSNASLPYIWFKNGDKIEGQASNTYTIPQNESGLYCCEILGQNSRILINTHCVTVFFRFNPRFRPPTTPTSASLPAGRVANLLCRATSSSDSSTNYDPPALVWTSSTGASGHITTNFSDEQGLAYIRVEMQESSSGTYSCAGNNSVNDISRDTELRSVDLGDSTHMYLQNGLAERSNENETWIPIGNASLTTFRNERVFMVSSDSANTALKQTIFLPQRVEMVYVRGRMRQSGALAQASAYPVIKLGFSNDNSILEIPFRTSEAWQWVGETFLTNGSTFLIIELTIMTTDASGVTQRETTEGVAFFDDISISFPGACPDGQFVCASGDCAASEDDCDSSDEFPIIIVAGTGGGVVLLLLVAIAITLCCCCCCCRHRKSDARPTRKLSTFITKTRYRRAMPPLPVSYTKTGAPDPQSPTSDAAYATLQGNTASKEAGQVRIPDAQSPESDHLYTSLRADIGTIDDNYYVNTEFPNQSQKKEQRENGHRLYTSLDPNSLDEQTYYTSASPVLPHLKKEELAASSVGGVANQDEGGVDLYLEVLPSAPSQSSREASPNPITSPTSISSHSDKAGGDKSHSEHFDPNTGEVYEYVNIDLGPN